MKRIETLVRQGKEHCIATRYLPSYKSESNGVSAMDIARAIDRIRESERVLRRAFP